ncbi:MAG: PD40 domain-containing protein [Solirubrobacterales bacterium]|nr:PD40 domain-containing protein [Solirubrobacterales bacterium]
MTKNNGADLRPDWSPDGRMVAFANNEDGDFDVYVTDAATGQTRMLLDTDADEKGPTWSPEGDRIAFSSTTDGNSEIWAIDSSGSGTPIQLTNEDAKSVSPDWSPDDDSIVFASDANGQFDIFVMKTDGTDLHSLTADTFDSPNAQEFDPSWSSDGEKISFDGRAGDDLFDIYVIDPDGSDLRNLTAHSANDRRSSWSPDDTKIVFGSDRQVPSDDTQRGCSVDTRQMDLYMMDSDGTDPQRLLGTEADDSSPAWGPLL